MPIKVLGPTHDRHPKNTRRENRLEELGRVDAEKAYTSKGKRNLRDEKHRIRTELKSGGPAGKTRGKHLTGDDPLVKWLAGGVKGKPHSSKEGRIASGKRKLSRLLQRYSDKSNYKNPRRKFPPEKPTWSDMPRKPLEKGKYQPLKKGGKSDKKWIQKATASIKRRKTEGKCTPITKKGCTGCAKALAKTFKKMAKKRKAA